MASYAISDIHGCLETFRQLLENGIKLRKKDHLYLLGDYINKGPESKGVLEYIMQLTAAGYQITCLRGNHDQLLLDAIDIGKGANWLPRPDQQRLLKNFGVSDFASIDQKYTRFIRSLPLFIKLKDFVLVHAGLDFSMPEAFLFNDPFTLLNIKAFHADRNKLSGRTLIHGHQPIPKSGIQIAVQQKLTAINIDAGCAYYKNRELGNLAALNLSTLTVIFQANCEQPYFIKKK